MGDNGCAQLPSKGRTQPRCWPVSGLAERPPTPSQALVQGAQWHVDGERIKKIRPLTVAGAAQAWCTMTGNTSLLPVELQHVNHAASTNGWILRLFTSGNPTIEGCMTTLSPTAQVAQRVERLLLQHAELQHTNTLLAEQVAALTQERDSLKSRLSAARGRVDALLERLPANIPLTKDAE